MKTAPKPASLADAIRDAVTVVADAASWTAAKATEADLNCQPPDLRTEMHSLNARLRDSQIVLRAALPRAEAADALAAACETAIAYLIHGPSHIDPEQLESNLRAALRRYRGES